MDEIEFKQSANSLRKQFQNMPSDQAQHFISLLDLIETVHQALIEATEDDSEDE